jgi:hypothetical protein
MEERCARAIACRLERPPNHSRRGCLRLPAYGVCRHVRSYGLPPGRNAIGFQNRSTTRSVMESIA